MSRPGPDGDGPLIGITVGDPAGVAPEITRTALAQLRGRGFAARYLAYAPAGLYGERDDLVYDEPDAVDPIRDAIERAAADLRDGQIDAVVTGPVSKSCFRGEFPGHTELFADRLSTPDFAMLLWGPKLRVVPVTTHVPLARVAELLTMDELLRVGRLVHRSFGRLGIDRPRIALAGLNPHAGDSGLVGTEEAELIAPAVEGLRAEGINASGPHSPDTVFHAAAAGRHDVVVAGYHDQALIPFKLLHFSDGVNVTLGLPRPRTSPDHGPAYDIAGKGLADATSMIRAIELAAQLVVA